MLRDLFFLPYIDFSRKFRSNTADNLQLLLQDSCGASKALMFWLELWLQTDCNNIGYGLQLNLISWIYG